MQFTVNVFLLRNKNVHVKFYYWNCKCRYYSESQCDVCKFRWESYWFSTQLVYLVSKCINVIKYSLVSSIWFRTFRSYQNWSTRVEGWLIHRSSTPRGSHFFYIPFCNYTCAKLNDSHPFDTFDHQFGDPI